MKNKFFNITWILCLVLVVLVGACHKKTENTLAQTPSVSKQKWEKTNDRICVLLGYGYNDEESTANLTQVFSENFGLGTEEGLVVPVVFPNDFRHADKAVNADFYSLLSSINTSDDKTDDEENEQTNLIGVILVGAPEGVSRAIFRMQDSTPEKKFSVVSFFSQDEVLAMQAASNIVIDRKAHETADDVVAAEYGQHIENDIADILVKTIELQKQAETEFASNKLIDIVKKIMPRHEVSHYVDAESGLTAANHFIVD